MILDRTKAPEATKISQPSFPDFDTQIIDGVEVTTLKHHAQPIVFLELVFDTGKVVEQVPEQSNLTAKLLTGGTKSKSAETIAETLDFYGSHLEIGSSFDKFNVKLYSLKKFFPSLLILLEDLLHNSEFSNKELTIQKSIREQQLRQQESKNNAIASRLFRANLFQDHPYGSYPTISDIQSLTREHLQDFFNEKLQTLPRIYLTGDIDDDLIGSVTRVFNGRKKLSTAKASLQPNQLFNIYEDKKDAVQTSLRLGLRSINRSHRDYNYLKITNDLLGGYFGSRLMKNIREEKGLTYGISSSINHLQQASYLIIGSDILKEKRDLAISEIEKEIKILQTEQVTNRELDALKNYLRGKLLSAFDSPFSSAQMIKTVVEWGIGAQAWQTYFDAIETIVPEHIMEMTNKYLEIEKINRVMVG
ncbi:MAG: pitrilysin family protein [Cyclobacteriaceae bacterium]